MVFDRLASLAAFFRARFSPEGYLGLQLTVGVVALTAAGWLFGLLAEDVATAGPITVIDIACANWLHAFAYPGLTKFMLFVTKIHGILGIVVLSVLTGIVFGWKKKWYWVLVLSVTMAGGMLLNVLTKHAFHRVRPSFDDPLLVLTTYSFPSGHTAGSTLFYGILAMYLVNHIQSWHWRMSVVAVAVFMVILVGFSRMYLGVHYLSDVLGATAESLAWLALSVTTIDTLRRRKQARGLIK